MALITEKIAQRMTAAKHLQASSLKNMADIARQAATRHDAIAKTDETGRDTALDALQATIDYCHSTIEAATGMKPTLPETEKHRGHDGKFAKEGSVSHLAGKLLARR